MTDVLDRAKALDVREIDINDNNLIIVDPEYKTILPGLVAECERLQSEYDNLRSSMIVIDGHRKIIELQEELTRWQKIAIEERAKILFYIQYEENPLEQFGLQSEEVKKKYRDQAARELGAPDEQVGTGVFLIEANQTFTDDDAARILKITETYLMDCDCAECRADVAVMMKFHDAVLARRSLTAEQRAALEYAISSLEQCDSEPEDPVAVEILQSMLAQSRPAWEITEERQAAIELAQYGFRGFPQDAIDASIAELQEMLEEAI
jgi:hypothetical protein